MGPAVYLIPFIIQQLTVSHRLCHLISDDNGAMAPQRSSLAHFGPPLPSESAGPGSAVCVPGSVFRVRLGAGRCDALIQSSTLQNNRRAVEQGRLF